MSLTDDILNALQAKPGQTRDELAETLDRWPGNVQQALRSLRKNGLVRIEEDRGNHVRRYHRADTQKPRGLLRRAGHYIGLDRGRA